MDVFKALIVLLYVTTPSILSAAEANIMINNRLSSEYTVTCASHFASVDPNKDQTFSHSEECNDMNLKRQFIMNFVYNIKIGFAGKVTLKISKSNKPIADCHVKYSIIPKKERVGEVEDTSFLKPKDGDHCQCHFQELSEKDQIECTIKTQMGTMSSMIMLSNQ